MPATGATRVRVDSASTTHHSGEPTPYLERRHGQGTQWAATERTAFAVHPNVRRDADHALERDWRVDVDGRVASHEDVVRPHGDCPVQLMALPADMPPSTNGPNADPNELIAVILGRPGDIPSMSISDIAELFELTHAEARLTIALCQGASVAEYACGRGISLGTARVQLKNALTKTQTHRQAELVRQVCASVATKAIRA